MSTPSGPVAATVSIMPAAAAVTTSQSLPVSIVVGGAASAPTPDGTVTVTSGAFSTGAVAVNGGKAAVTIPAGVLAAASTGSATLSVQYTPSAAASAAYLAGAGTATVSVSDAAAPTVTATPTGAVATNGHPFIALPVGSNVLISVSQNTDAGSVTGLRVYSAPTPSALSYTCTQTAAHLNHMGLSLALGLVALPNGLDLALAVDDPGLDLLNLSAVTGGCKSGETLVSQGVVPGASNTPVGQGTFAVAVTPDGKYAFVANEYGVAASDSNGNPIEGNIGVVKLSYDASGHVSGGVLAGQISTGSSTIANVTLSPDGSRLYVTSEVVSPGAMPAGASNPTLTHGGCPQQQDQPLTANGALSVIDVAKAEAAPNASAIIATVAAGCSPVRVVETADQQVIWVAARGDNAVLAFSTHMLETNPGAALLGSASTGGIAPVGLQLFHGGQLLAVANSNRFAMPAVVGNMAIMSAIPVHPAVLRTVDASYFPRSVTVAADDSTLYLTDYDGGIVQIIATAVG